MPSLFSKHNTRLTLLRCLLIVYVLVSQGPLTSLVVCFGANGHFQIETAHTNTPDSSHAQHHPGPCLDFPFASFHIALKTHASPSDSASISWVRGPVVTPFLDFVLLPSTSAESITPRLLSDSESTSETPIAFLRSTILV